MIKTKKKPFYQQLQAPTPASEIADTAIEAIIAANRAAQHPPPERLINKVELLTLVPYSFPTIWNWMRQEPPKFPRNRVVGQRNVWLASEVTEWMRSRPVAVHKKPGEPADPADIAKAARARAGKKLAGAR
jgi:predicted DNA-binding transcriptional regulator AlpA